MERERSAFGRAMQQAVNLGAVRRAGERQQVEVRKSQKSRSFACTHVPL